MDEKKVSAMRAGGKIMAQIFADLREYGVLMQVNASFFIRFMTKRRALKLLTSGGIQLIGSDTHNTTVRAPKLGLAYDIIEKKLGESLICEINGYGYYLLNISI